MPTFDLLVKNASVVRPAAEPAQLDLGVVDGVVRALAQGLPPEGAAEVVDAGGKLLFPGVVDVHQHWGIYSPLAEDAATESAACAHGGVTTGITYIRTGQYYMNRSGPYAEVLPEAVAAAEGRSYVDFAFHVAPILRQHLGEIPAIVRDLGVPSFKIFMFYGKHGLHGRSASQDQFLMLPAGEAYDYAHFEFVMRELQKVREDPAFAAVADDVSLSLHCETAEIMDAYTKLVEEEGVLKGLEAYHASRPPHSEGLAITVAAYLAHETGMHKINLLHLSSAKAVEAALLMQRTFPRIDFRREVTVGHLLLDIRSVSGVGGKVNPPLRPREDVEALWTHLLAGDVDWVVSDHACCRDEVKFGEPRDDVFLAKSGFGGTEYLLPGLLTEGRRRGLPLGRIAELVSKAPAERFGLHTKGDLAPGYDADFCLVDPDARWTVRAADSASAQEYTPFEGFEMGARVTDTYLRGVPVLAGGVVAGPPRGSFVRRPTRRPVA